MKKPRVLVFIAAVAIAWVIADIYRLEVQKRSELTALCTLVPVRDSKSIRLSPASPSARAAVKWIAATAGVAPNFEIFAGTPVPGVAYATFRNNRRLIVYDTASVRWGKNAARWREVGVIAHEIGHHLGAHPFITGKDAHAREGEADAFSGYAAALLGASLDQALSFSNEFPASGGASHPPREKRRAAIAAGWRRGQGMRKSPA